MDHKISKDMISSGMIPSGEKTQADLGRTQYGSAPSPSSLMNAYKSIYEHHQKDKDGNTIPHEGEELNEVAPLLAAPLIAKGGGKKTTTTTQTKKPGLIQKLKDRTAATKQAIDQLNQDIDLFDLVKGKLIDEGCDELEAIKIMVNLSEEELNELLGGKPGDGYLGHPNLGIKNPFAKKQIKKPVQPGTNAKDLPNFNINKIGSQIGDRNMKLKQMIDEI